MTDTHARTLERAAAAGDPEAAAQHLRQRVRSGEMQQAQVELLAYLGHEGARELVGVEHCPLAYAEYARAHWEGDS